MTKTLMTYSLKISHDYVKHEPLFDDHFSKTIIMPVVKITDFVCLGLIEVKGDCIELVAKINGGELVLNASYQFQDGEITVKWFNFEKT